MSKIAKACLMTLLNKIKSSIYEYSEVWAEESSGLQAGYYEWSFGNGATGQIGLPVSSDNEIYEAHFHANTFSSAATVTIAVVDMLTLAELYRIEVEGSTDNIGTTNNAAKLIDLRHSPITLPDDTVIGFQTIAVSGSISNARVGVRLRKPMRY